MSLKVYCAASSQDGERIRFWERELRRAGIGITSTWSPGCEKWAGKDHLLPRLDQRNQALLCESQIRDSDVVWLMMPEAGQTTIGAYWEAGFARGVRKRLYISGTACRASAFCGLADFTHPHDSDVYARLVEYSRADDTMPMATLALGGRP